MEENLLAMVCEKIRQADLLLQKCDLLIHKNIEGAMKLKRKVQTEVGFLEQLEKQPSLLRPSHVASTNLTHLNAICNAALAEANVMAVLAPFPRFDSGQSNLLVDIVADGGSTWIKVVARSAKGLHFAWSGDGNYQDRGIVDQANDYVSTSAKNPHIYKAPKIVFLFSAGVTRPIAEDLKQRFGVACKGDVVAIDPSWGIPECGKDNLSEDGSDMEDVADKESTGDAPGQRDLPQTTDNPSENQLNSSLPDSLEIPLNLDITALIAYVSALTNGNGARYRFREPLLDEQATWERQRPALPLLKKYMDLDVGRRLICCKTARDSFMEILETVGGEGEKERAKALLQRVEVVDDQLSERTANLQLGQRVKNRSKVIFGSGEYYKALTLTANRRFVHSAENQGVRLAVILHESRALSEQKQQHAVPL